MQGEEKEEPHSCLSPQHHSSYRQAFSLLGCMKEEPLILLEEVPFSQSKHPAILGI